MEKGKKIILIIINVLFLIVFVFAVIIPVDRKAVKYSNTDISEYSDVESIPRIGAITDNRNAEIKFRLYEGQLYGVQLFFYAEGEHEDGEISCTLLFDGDKIDKVIVPVKELFTLMSSSSVNAKELLFKTKPELSGEYTLILEGDGIDPKTRIALYGSRGTNRYMNYVNSGYQEYNEILYSIETLEPQHPYIWATALMLVMSFLFSYIMYVGGREKEIEVTV